ncbi:MAG: PEP-utilizing enzyme [Thermoleophilia bacterium]
MRVRRIAAMRTVMLVLGDRRAERGDLSAADDIFFLSLEEIMEGGPAGRRQTDGALGPGSEGRGDTMGVRDLVAGRRAEFQRDRLIEPPAVFVGHLSPLELWPTAPEPGLTSKDTQAVGVLRGLGVSSGVAEGPARVMPTVDSVESVLPGEVLVAPFTDPGWAPFLLPAAGIVMNMGGLLSHGSIIAREYGIPAVVNVGPATSTIRTGQRIRVDGDRGIVTILD